MEAIDYLNQKTTNINVRISPMLKTQLIERGAKMGVNLSDYIGYVLTKDMKGQNDPKQSEEYKELSKQCQRLQAELEKFQAVAEPYSESLNQDITIDGKIYHFEHPSDLFNYIIQNFKIKN